MAQGLKSVPDMSVPGITLHWTVMTCNYSNSEIHHKLPKASLGFFLTQECYQAHESEFSWENMDQRWSSGWNYAQLYLFPLVKTWTLYVDPFQVGLQNSAPCCCRARLDAQSRIHTHTNAPVLPTTHCNAALNHEGCSKPSKFMSAHSEQPSTEF